VFRWWLPGSSCPREIAGRLSGFDHGLRDPVFHGSAGIDALQLCPNLDIGIRTDPLQPYQRSIPDQGQEPSENIAAFMPAKAITFGSDLKKIL